MEDEISVRKLKDRESPSNREARGKGCGRGRKGLGLRSLGQRRREGLGFGNRDNYRNEGSRAKTRTRFSTETRFDTGNCFSLSLATRRTLGRGLLRLFGSTQGCNVSLYTGRLYTGERTTVYTPPYTDDVAASLGAANSRAFAPTTQLAILTLSLSVGPCSFAGRESCS